MTAVSVIIPVYNAERWVSRCLDSLLSQTLQDLEIIAVDDGSVDGSLGILKRYHQQDSRVKVIALEKNQGVSRARNLGIESATGTYVAFVDADDVVEASFYDKLYQRALATGADIVKGDLKEIFPDGQVKTYTQNQDILTYQSKMYFMISFTSAIYRIALLKEKRCYFDTRLTYAEDLVWLNRMVRMANTVEVVPDVYYHYLRRDDSTDTWVVSDRNARSAYVGFKHIFFGLRQFEKESGMDCSNLYRNNWGNVLFLMFRIPSPEIKRLFCKLLFFYYQCHPNFFASYLQVQFPVFFV